MILNVLLAAITGILAGGVVNALADDLPQRRKPGRPKYSDGTPRPPAAWLGITAFLLGKRAAPDGSRLSWRYPIAELLTAALMVLSVIQTQNDPHAWGVQMIFLLFYMAVFVLITVIDIEHKLILFAVIIPSSILAILDALLSTLDPNLKAPNLVDSLAGGVIGFVVFFILYNGGFLFTYIMGHMRGEKITTVAFGYGDVMMAMLSGLILGWNALIFAMFFTVFLGALGAIVYLIIHALLGRKYSMYTALPYGPYIVAGTLIMLLFSDSIPVLLGWK